MSEAIDFDANEWDGDPELLKPYTEQLLYDGDLCEITFASEYEAFYVGFYLGQEAERLELGSVSPALGDPKGESAA
jgi:hypothetical protein